MKIFIGTIVTILLASVGVYVLLFSSAIANETWVMNLRYKYVVAIDKYDNLKPIIRAMRKDSFNKSLYLYSFRGKLEKVTIDSIYLRGKDGQSYRFPMGWMMLGDEDVQHYAMIITEVSMMTAKPELLTFSKTDITKSPGTLSMPFDPEQIYGVMWADSRKLTQVIKDHKKNPEEPMYIVSKEYDPLKYLVKYE